MPQNQNPRFEDSGLPHTRRIRRRMPQDGNTDISATEQDMIHLAQILQQSKTTSLDEDSMAELTQILQRQEHTTLIEDNLGELSQLLARQHSAGAESENLAELSMLLQNQEGTSPPRAKKQKRIPKEKKQRDKSGADSLASSSAVKKRFRIGKKQLALGFLSLCFLFIIAAGFFFVYTTRNDDLWLDLETIPYRGETILYYTDQNSGEYVEYASIPCTQNKEYVPYEEIPQNLINAFVAIEDKEFFTHFGIDISRTIFAVLNELSYAVTGQYIGGDDGQQQGASTITQQLIKNLTRDDADSDMAGYLRKIREICRAIRLDALYTKEEIMHGYLNTISFTGNTAGVQAEAKKLFNKPVSELTLAECASIASITRNPSRYNPNTNPEYHLERRNYILNEMYADGYITADEHAAAIAEPLNLSGNPEPALPAYTTDYFTDTVIEMTIEEFENQYNLTRQEASHLIFNGGLRIFTTADPTLQSSMEYVMETSQYHPRPVATATKPLYDDNGDPILDESGNAVTGEVQVTPQGAMISLDYDGGIRGVVGALGEKTISRGLNRATQTLRQIGSTMKPISPYVTALEEDIVHWSTPFLDSPFETITDPITGQETGWPSNSTMNYTNDDVLTADALADSINTVAVRIGDEVGTSEMMNFLQDELGISTLTDADNSLGPLCLGSTTYGISAMDLAMSYAMFGNGGYLVTPHSFTHIENGAGGTLLTVNTDKTRVISEETAYIMNRMLALVTSEGTAAGFSGGGGMESIGKTGTTNDGRDHWFVGLTPYYVTASWYGYDENIPLSVDRSTHPPTRAWQAVMQTAQQNLTPLAFDIPSGVVELNYCTESGCIASEACPSVDTGWYNHDNTPDENCPLH